MVKAKSAHASNQKVIEQANQATVVKNGPNKELVGLVDSILAKEDARKKINDDIRNVVVEIKERFGIPASTTRQILKEKRMESEAYSQYAHSCNDMRRMLNMQLDLDLVIDSRNEDTLPEKNTALDAAAHIASIYKN